MIRLPRKDGATDIRCGSCNKLLCVEDDQSLLIEIKCGRCNKICTYDCSAESRAIVIDLQGNIIHTNEVSGVLMHKALAEIINKKRTSMSGQDCRGLYENIWHKLMNREKVVVDIPSWIHDDPECTMRLKITPLFDKTGSICFFLGTATIIYCDYRAKPVAKSREVNVSTCSM